jgi:hypothetical protein
MRCQDAAGHADSRMTTRYDGAGGDVPAGLSRYGADVEAENEEFWTERSYLTGVQYKSDANLIARSSIYDFQQPHINLPEATLGSAHLDGSEVVADIG